LVYPIPPGEPVRVDIVAQEPNPFGRLFFPSISHEAPDTPIRPMFLQASGTFDLELEVGSRTAVIEPTIAHVRVMFLRAGASPLATLLVEGGDDPLDAWPSPEDCPNDHLTR